MTSAETELSNCLVDLLSLPQETRWLEYKENCLPPERIGVYVSALSNGACLDMQSAGWLILGVTDDSHKIVGTTLRLSTMKIGNEPLEFHLRKSLSPRIALEFCVLEWEGKHVEAIRVAPAVGEPTAYLKTPYIRINSNTTELMKYPDLVRQLYNSRRDWFEELCPGATVEDLDENAVQAAKEVFVKRHADIRDEVATWSTKVFLQKCKLMRGDNPTRAAILLLGKDTSSHLLTPYSPDITWKLETEQEKAYEHFGLPFILTTTKILHKIRNYVQKIFPENALLAAEFTKYDTEMILEALHNCIAHQDYSQNARIIITETEDRLIFKSTGSFYWGKPADYPLGEITPEKYRNKFLADSMHRVGMVDTMGYGIHKMYQKQRERCFPMPDYELNSESVQLTIYGKAIDERYGKLLLEHSDVSLEEAIALDYVQKGQPLPASSIAILKQKKLIEGRKPNYHLSKGLAVAIGEGVKYLESKGMSRQLIKEHICDSLREVESLNRKELTLLVEKLLPQTYSDKQKYYLISRLITELSTRDHKIRNIGKKGRGAIWELVKR